MARETPPATTDQQQIDQLERGNGGENEQQIDHVVRDQLKRIISFSVAIITMDSAVILAFLNGAKDITAMHSPAVTKAYCLLIWPTIQSPIMLLMYAFFLFGHYKRIGRNQKIYLISAIATSCVLLIVTSLFSLVLLNKDSAGILSLIAAPVIAKICFLGYRATQNVNDHDSTVDDHESFNSYKPEQKKAFKFATSAATLAITLQTGMIYASFKSAPLRASPSIQLALSLFFLIATVGVFVMMVASIPSTVHYSFWRGSLLSIARYSSAAILVLLGLSAAALAMQLLGSSVVGVFLLVLVPICAYFAQEHCGGIGLGDPTSGGRALYRDPRYAGVIRGGIATLVSFNGGLLAAVCAASVGIAPQQHYYMTRGLRVCAFFQFLAVESGLIWIGLMFEPQHGAAWASVVEIFYSVSLLLQIVVIMAGQVMLFIVRLAGAFCSGDRFTVKIRFDASIAESQQSIPDQRRSVSQQVADSQDPVPGQSNFLIEVDFY